MTINTGTTPTAGEGTSAEAETTSDGRSTRTSSCDPGVALASTEELIEEARNGRMFILVDDEDRENEGDLVIPAQMVTPEKINFMATFGRGLICLALTKERSDQLGLSLMNQGKPHGLETAFTVSIEACEGVTTGISAADRARTVAVAIDASRSSHDIVSPGHVFPLVARGGGVLIRAGHTEAAVDFARLAGLNASGVICEIMNDDGTMARFSDLASFARLHDLKIGTIRDLIAYRSRHDRLIEKISEIGIDSVFGGNWRAVAYRNRISGNEMLALIKGTINPSSPTLVRMHHYSLVSDTLGGKGPRTGLLEGAMRMIGDAGSGVVVLINRPTPDYLSSAMNARKTGAVPEEMPELRDYGMGAQILADLGIHQIVLLTNTHQSPVSLAGYGLSIVEERRIEFGADSR